MEFIKAPKTGECVFCPMQHASDDRALLILWRGKHCFCVMNKYPYNPAHVLVMPYVHGADISALPADAQRELMWAMGKAMDCLTKAVGAQGMNCGLNYGQVGGAGVLDHLHFHIVPRWQGDCNFLPIFGDTKSLPEYLDETYAQLLPVFTQEMTSEEQPCDA